MPQLDKTTPDKANILLVDDHAPNLLALEAVLAPLGQNLLQASSGEQALWLLCENDVAVILLDVQMQEMDGFETARLIRTRAASRYTPIIFVTAHETDRQIIEHAYSLGAVDFLVKPLSPIILTAKVQGFIDVFQNARRMRLQEERLRILEREQFAMAVRGHQEWFRVTLSSIGDGVITTDKEGHVTFINPVAESLTGWKSQEAAGQPLETVFPIIHETTRQQVENPVTRVIRDGVIVGLGNHTVLIAKDGTERPIDDSAAPIKDDGGSISGAVLIFRDVSERRKAENEVRESEARKTAALETALDCIITIDSQDRVIDFNPAAERTFGYRQAEALGKRLGDLIVPPSLRERHYQGMTRFLATGEGPVLGKRLEMPAMRSDGSEFPVEMAIICIPSHGQPLFTAYLRDITERVRTERHRNVRLSITHAMAHATAIREAVIRVLRAICEGLGWDLGFFWTLDGAGETLVCLESWHLAGMNTTEFETHSRQRTFERGEGLPGEVWATGKPIWLPDVAKAPNFPRVAHAARQGLHAAIGCPIVLGEETLGIIEFFSEQIRRPDADFLEMMETIAVQIGQFLERKQSEQDLRQSEQQLADFFDNASVGLHWVGPDGIILRANQAELDLLGYSRDEYLGHHIAEFHVDEDVICDILKRLQTGEKLREYSARLRCKDGSIKDVLIDSSVLWEDGRFIHTRCFTRDVTERKFAERALRESEQATRFLADASAALAALVDYESTLQKVARSVVPAFADWCAIDVIESDGTLRRLAVAHVDPVKVKLAHELHRRHPPDPAAPRGVFQVARTGKSELVEEITDELLVQGAENQDHLRILRELGLRSYLCVPLWVRGKGLGAITFVAAESGRRFNETHLTVAEDLAHRAAIAIENAHFYAELKEADRLKDEYLAMLAHELRNPLAPIRNALHIMKMPEADQVVLGEVRDMAERQVQHMAALLDDLLDISRISRGKIELHSEQVDLKPLLNRTVAATRGFVEERGHHLSVSFAPEPLLVNGDPTRLEQIVTNLLNNAAKYTDPGGHIWLNAERDGEELVIRVRDDGIGIHATMLPKIFDLFVQAERRVDRSQGGVGIGLTLVKRLTELHGGTIDGYSPGPGEGSEFVVRLRAVTGARTAGDSKSPAGSQIDEHAHRRVLVVDDNQDAADSLGLVLRAAGHDVTVAYDGSHGLSAAAEFKPEIAFLDIGMPGMDGYEVARRMRQLRGMESTVLVALTGWGQEEDRRRSKSAGFDHHLIKPVEPEVMQELMNHVGR